MELLEHNLAHLLTILLCVFGRLSEENVVFLSVNSEFVAEAVLPDLLDVIPVSNNTVFNWVLKN